MLWLPKANLYHFMLETNYHKENPVSGLPLIWNEDISSQNETYQHNNITNLFVVYLQKHPW